MENKEYYEAVERLEELLMLAELKEYYGIDLKEVEANVK